MATTQSSVRIIKQFEYRGQPDKEFSNRYYFDGSAPSSSAAWHDLMDAIVAVEKAVYAADVHITEAFGYDPGSEVAVANRSFSQAGTHIESGASLMPGDCAAVLRMATTKRSSKNHVVYCFSYFHGVERNTSTADHDSVAPGQKTAIETYGQHWLDGITVGARTYVRTTPDGHAVTGRACDPWIGHRDFPR